jgi:FixJ family two-component response regulator
MSEKESPASMISGFLGKLKDSGEAAFEELSNQLMENPLFMEALKKSLETKGEIDKKVSGAMDFMNLPSKNDVSKLLEEIERVRSRMAKQQRMLKNVQSEMEEMKKLINKEAGE